MRVLLIALLAAISYAQTVEQIGKDGQRCEEGIWLDQFPSSVEMCLHLASADNRCQNDVVSYANLFDNNCFCVTSGKCTLLDHDSVTTWKLMQQSRSRLRPIIYIIMILCIISLVYSRKPILVGIPPALLMLFLFIIGTFILMAMYFYSYSPEPIVLDSHDLFDVSPRPHANISKCTEEYKPMHKHMMFLEGRKIGSEDNEDQLIYNEYFRHHPRGIYVELGAFDGIQASNTLFFEYCLGWRGILIEPGFSTYKRLIVNRPNNMHVHAAIGCEGSVKFVDTGYTSMTMNNDQHPTEHTFNHEVQCISLQKVLDDAGISHVNFLSLDVEGMETDVLQSVDFERTIIDVIMLESHHMDSVRRTREFMKTLEDYILQKHFVHRSDVFLHKSMALMIT